MTKHPDMFYPCRNCCHIWCDGRDEPCSVCCRNPDMEPEVTCDFEDRYEPREREGQCRLTWTEGEGHPQ
jgi:hypothetical protein